MNIPALSGARASTSRRKARIVALQVLYEIEGARRDPGRALENRLREQSLIPSSEEFAQQLVEGVIANRAAIDPIISTFAPSWPINQIASLDRNILRLAIFEIMMGGETPPKVAINEAVDLAKIFGSDSSPKFVNGVLGSVIENAKLGTES